MPEREYWKDKRILIVSHEAWGPVRLSKHHYASTLMKQGAEVFFLGPDGSRSGKILIAPATGDAPAIVHRPRPMQGLRRLPAAFRAMMEAQQLRELAQASGGAFDILWNFDLYRFRSLSDRGSARLRIVHVMDLKHPADLLEPASHADLVIVVSPSMTEGLNASTISVLHIPHGLMPRKEVSFHLPAFPLGPRLGYLGNLAMRGIHWPSLLEIARDHRQAQLVLMGPLHGAFGDSTRLDPSIESALRSLPNVHFTGALPYDEVPAWLEAMDVLLIAYDLEAQGVRATSSHKLLEYLASGKVVLCSYLEDHAEMTDLIEMTRPGQRITERIGEVLHDLARLNTETLRSARMAYGASRTYDAHLGRIETFLIDADRQKKEDTKR